MLGGWKSISSTKKQPQSSTLTYSPTNKDKSW